MLRVLLVDDHAVVRNGMRQILQENLESVETGEASDAMEAITQVRSHHWDLVLLDISLPDQTGAVSMYLNKSNRRNRNCLC